MIDKIEQALDHEGFAYPAIVFVRRKAEAEELAQQLQDMVDSVEFVTGDVSRAVRTEYAERMRAGALDLVVATDAWATGLDIPGLRSVVIACGGKARVGLKQRAGRGCRRADCKVSFTIFDVSEKNSYHQQRQRLARYQEGGFDVEMAPPIRKRADEVVDEDLDFALDGGRRGERKTHALVEVTADPEVLAMRFIYGVLTFFGIMIALIWICGIFGW